MVIKAITALLIGLQTEKRGLKDMPLETWHQHALSSRYSVLPAQGLTARLGDSCRRIRGTHPFLSDDVLNGSVVLEGVVI